MPISEMPIFSMLRTRMQWHQERQRLLAENVANRRHAQIRATRPRPADLQPGAAASRSPHPGRHERGQPGSGATTSPFQLERRLEFEARPSGDAVSLEEEMLKVASNAMDYQAATALYTRGLGRIKSALGKR